MFLEPIRVVMCIQNTVRGRHQRRIRDRRPDLPKLFDILGKHDGNPGLQRADEFHGFQVGHLEVDQPGIEMRPGHVLGARQQQNGPDRGKGQPSGARSPRGLVSLGGFKVFQFRREDRQYRRKHRITGQKAKDQSGSGDDAQLAGTAEFGKDRDKKRAGGAEACRVDRRTDVFEHANPDRRGAVISSGLQAIAGKNLHQIIHPDADQARSEKPAKGD